MSDNRTEEPDATNILLDLIQFLEDNDEGVFQDLAEQDQNPQSQVTSLNNVDSYNEIPNNDAINRSSVDVPSESNYSSTAASNMRLVMKDSSQLINHHSYINAEYSNIDNGGKQNEVNFYQQDSGGASESRMPEENQDFNLQMPNNFNFNFCTSKSDKIVHKSERCRGVDQGLELSTQQDIVKQEKEKVKREKNKQAARKSRLKKRTDGHNLSESNKKLLVKNKELEKQMSKLKENLKTAQAWLKDINDVCQGDPTYQDMDMEDVSWEDLFLKIKSSEETLLIVDDNTATNQTDNIKEEQSAWMVNRDNQSFEEEEEDLTKFFLGNRK